MIQNVLRTLGGIEGYGIASLCIFFSVFSVAVIWALTRNKADLDQMARMPIEDSQDSFRRKDLP